MEEMLCHHSEIDFSVNSEDRTHPAADLPYMDRMHIKTKLPPNATSADKDNPQFGILWEPDWIDIHNDDQLYARVRENGRAVIVVGDGGLLGNPKALRPADFERLWKGD